MKSEEQIRNREQETQDLGFGTVLSRHPHYRLLNRDGSFNIGRPRLGFWATLNSYHALLSMSWPRFFGLITATYLVINIVFAGLYLLCGLNALQGSPSISPLWRAFFFSIETFSTIGYGNIVPIGIAANLVVTLESFFGLLSFAFAAGLVFARFSRPLADIIYSKVAVIAPYRGITAFEFRIINGRSNQLIELQMKLTLTRFETVDGTRIRRFYPLRLERETVAFFPLNWTIVHPIDESSPLYGWTGPMLLESEAEFLILLTAIDETFAQSVNSRSSYAAHEVVWNARFLPVIEDGPDEKPTVNMAKFHRVEPLDSKLAKLATADRR